MRGQSEARLQVTKTSDIKEGQDKTLLLAIPFTEMIGCLGLGYITEVYII